MAPVFFLMLFAVFEFGFLFRNSLTTTNASREGARAASVHGAGRQTDFLVLQTVAHGLAAQGAQAVEYVVIYKVNAVGDEMDVRCHDGPVQDVCNYYTAADFEAPFYDIFGDETGNFGCVPDLSLDRYWCPTDREDNISTPPDLVGVYVRTRHEYMTGFIGDETILEETTVIRIEPEAE